MMHPKKIAPGVTDRILRKNSQELMPKRKRSEDEINRKMRLAIIREYARAWGLSDMKVSRLFDEYHRG